MAQQHIASRREYWSAGKRRAGKLLRLTGDSAGSGVQPASSRPGPSTFASQKEELLLATKAIALLLPRDQQLIGWMLEG